MFRAANPYGHEPAIAASAISTPLSRRGKRSARVDMGLWRRETADASGAAIDALAIALTDLRIEHEPTWSAATGGDPAAAVGIAVRHLFRGTSAPTDLVMSCLLVHAARGDATAELVLTHARSRRDGSR